MKQISLSKVPDGSEFQLSTRGDVWYTIIKKVKEGIVFTSTSSNRSFKKPGKTKVYVSY